jgi:hypothetical protein
MEHGNLRDSFVLDTSLFVNPATQQRFGGGTEEAVRRFLELAGTSSLRLYMPVSIFRELSHFISPDVLAGFRSASVVRAPNLHSLQVPAALFHTFIRDLRDRINRGLRVAEKALRVGDIPDKVKWLREHYRSALRSGIVDSVEDFDVVMLALEVRGIILSADQGIARMAEELGLEVYSAEDFVRRFGKGS